MGKKILLADDSITIQKVIELTFSDEDFDVVTVGNGRLALERLPEVRPDIVLCDIIMPEKDGYEVCEQIKSSPSWSHLPVLLLTGAFEPFDQERATRAGYDGSLAKPFEPETLIAKVKELLARVPRPAPARPVGTETSTAVPVPSFVLPPAVPPLAPPPASAASAEEVAPLAGDFIPEEPFTGLGDGFGADASAVTAPRAPIPEAMPLAEISEEESAALAPPATFEEPAEDTVSTVMFRASDLPWRTPPSAAPATPPAVVPPAAEPAEEPLFVGEPVATAGAPPEPIEPIEAPVFEAVMEEDLEFGGTDYTEAEPESHSFDDASVAEPQVEEDIFAAELTARSPVSGVGEGASGAFAALVQDQVPVADGASDTNTFAEPLRLPAASVPPLPSHAAPEGEPERPVAEAAHAPLAPTAEAMLEPEAAIEPEPEAAIEPEPELEEIEEQPSAVSEEPAVIHEAVPAAEPEPEVFESFEPAPEAEELFETTPAAVTAASHSDVHVPDEVPFEVAWPDEPLPSDEPMPVVAESSAPAEAMSPEELLPIDEPAAAAAEEPPHAFPAPVPLVAPAVLPVAAATAPAPAAQPKSPVAVPEESFGDVAEAMTQTEPRPPASEAATLAVPVETVEKIAQRVVAQISEKTVREIAWEVIPDLAEALIKQEIEKLKAELAKL